VTRKRAQARVDLGTDFFRSGEYEAARVEFMAANSLLPLPAYTYYIARCYEEMGEIGRAIELLGVFLKNADDEARAAKARAALKRLGQEVHGAVLVACQPGTAWAHVEGIGKGECPFRRDRLRPGTYAVTVRAPEHATWEGQIRVVAGEVAEASVVLKATPKTEPALLTVRSRPAGAAVVVDGEEVGRTPLVRHVVGPGEHVVVLRLAKYEGWARRVRLERGRVEQLRSFPTNSGPRRRPGQLR